MSSAPGDNTTAAAEADAARPSAGSELLVVRLSGDLSTKARPTRAHFSRRLVRNMKDALRSSGVRSQVTRTHDRIYVELAEPGAAETLARVFGIQSLSRAERRTWEGVADVAAAGVEIFGVAVRGKRFAVRARRVGDRRSIPFSSKEIAVELGKRLLVDADAVDLDDPEIVAHVEVSTRDACFYGDTLPGHGGLPLGVEGRAVTLVSGGFDSAVAAWQLLKRGVAQDYVFCNLGGRAHQLGTLRVMKVIADRWSYGTRPRFHALDFDPVSRGIQTRTQTRYWQILLKRLMYRAAEQVAAEVGAVAIVTGEAVGQVSSQTLQNLSVISRAAELPVLRPLVGYNKDEILAVARRIGTYDLSKVVGEYCAMVPRKPATAATLEAVEAEEARLEPDLVERAVRERMTVDLRSLDVEKLDISELEASEIPSDAIVLDLRSRAAYRGWHYPGALFLDFAHALATYRQLDREKTFVLYCEFGLKSAHLAELMRAEGFEAFHFRNGLAAVVEYARATGHAGPELGSELA